MIIILSFPIASLSPVKIYWTTVTTFNVTLVDELVACTDRPVPEVPVAVNTAARGAETSNMSAVPVVVDVGCFDIVQLRRTALVR
jgi:hypothetical protein